MRHSISIAGLVSSNAINDKEFHLLKKLYNKHVDVLGKFLKPTHFMKKIMFIIFNLRLKN